MTNPLPSTALVAEDDEHIAFLLGGELPPEPAEGPRQRHGKPRHQIGQGLGMAEQRLPGGPFQRDESVAQAAAEAAERPMLEAVDEKHGGREEQPRDAAHQRPCDTRGAQRGAEEFGLAQHLGQLAQLQGQNTAADRAYAAQLVGLRQATASDPFQAVLGRPSAAFAQAQGLQGQGVGLQQLAGPALFNPESSYANNIYGGNQQSQQQAAQQEMARAQALGTVGTQLGGLTQQQQQALLSAGSQTGQLTQADLQRQQSVLQQMATQAQQGQQMRTQDVAALEAAGLSQQQIAQRQADAAYQQYMLEQQYPKTQLDWLSTQVRGMAPNVQTAQTQSGTTTGATYSASPLQQLATGLSATAGLNKLLGS